MAASSAVADSATVGEDVEDLEAELEFMIDEINDAAAAKEGEKEEEGDEEDEEGEDVDVDDDDEEEEQEQEVCRRDTLKTPYKMTQMVGEYRVTHPLDAYILLTSASEVPRACFGSTEVSFIPRKHS